MEFLDKDNRRVTMSYKTNNDCPDGNHVLAIPLYKNQLLLLSTKCVALSFQVVRLKKENKVYKQSRETFEETGGIPETIDYIAQYQVHTFDNSIFKKMYIS